MNFLAQSKTKTKRKSKDHSSSSKYLHKNSRNQSVKNLKANTADKPSDVPIVEFDFTASTVEGPPMVNSQHHKPSMFSRKSSLKKYLNPDAPANPM